MTFTPIDLWLIEHLAGTTKHLLTVALAMGGLLTVFFTRGTAEH